MSAPGTKRTTPSSGVSSVIWLKADLAVLGKRAVATALKLLKFHAAEKRYRVFGNQMFLNAT